MKLNTLALALVSVLGVALPLVPVVNAGTLAEDSPVVSLSQTGPGDLQRRCCDRSRCPPEDRRHCCDDDDRCERDD